MGNEAAEKTEEATARRRQKERERGNVAKSKDMESAMVMIGGMSKVVKDVPPFIKLDGNPARVVGLNTVGLQRNNVSKESLAHIKELYKVFFRSDKNVSQIMEQWENLVHADDPMVKQFHDFIKEATRGCYKRTANLFVPGLSVNASKE